MYSQNSGNPGCDLNSVDKIGQGCVCVCGWVGGEGGVHTGV